jgi:phenylacetate-CoA ligase
MKRMRYATDALNTMTRDEIIALQETKLRSQLKYCVRNSELYRRKLNEIGVDPADIKSIEDFRSLPVMMDKDQQRASEHESLKRHGHPFGMHLCCSPDDVVLTATTSGTTGIPTFSYTQAQSDLDKISKAVAYMMEYTGISSGDRVLFSYALGVYATSAFIPGIRLANVLPIDVDVRAGAAKILQFLQLTRPDAAMMTPSLAEYLIREAPEITGSQVGEFNLSALLTTGEIAVGIPEVKEKIESAYGCRQYDWLSPTGATAIAFSCDSDEYYGLHCVTPDLDLYPYDLVDPVMHEPKDIADGVIGEAVYTSLDHLAAPMIRVASGDIIQIFTKECPGCGFKGLRARVLGRNDDMLIVKGANVYPAAIKQTVAQFVPAVTGEIRVVLDQEPPRVIPPLKVKLEYGPDTDSNDLSDLGERIRNTLSQEVRVSPDIIWCAPGTLEKSMAKTPLFEKND